MGNLFVGLLGVLVALGILVSRRVWAVVVWMRGDKYVQDRAQ